MSTAQLARQSASKKGRLPSNQLMTSEVAGLGWPRLTSGIFLSALQLPGCLVEPLCSPTAAWSCSTATVQRAAEPCACRVAQNVLPCRSLSTNPERNLSALWGKLAAEILMQNWDTAMDYLTKLKVHLSGSLGLLPSRGRMCSAARQHLWVEHQLQHVHERTHSGAAACLWRCLLAFWQTA